MEFLAANARHTLFFEQRGSELRGTHQGGWLSGDLRGRIDSDQIRFRSSQKYEGGYLNYEFAGTIDGDRIEGTVTDMSTITPGEYGQARWRAHRHSYAEPSGSQFAQPRKSD
jgi:hypothetical protein